MASRLLDVRFVASQRHVLNLLLLRKSGGKDILNIWQAMMWCRFIAPAISRNGRTFITKLQQLIASSLADWRHWVSSSSGTEL
jgi:hypothetical protein